MCPGVFHVTGSILEISYFAIERRAEARGVGLHSSDQSSEGSDDSQPEENALVEGGNYRSDNYHSL